MATDSTNLPQGETTLDASIDMAASDLDLTMVQEAAATEPANYVDLPGKTVILLPVEPGQTVRLPTDSTAGLLAKIGPEGNLAIVVDGRTIILQGFLKANDQSPIKIVTNDGEEVNVADVVAATDQSLDIQTAAGPAAGAQGDAAEGSGIYVPFLAGPGLGGIDAEGILDPTALQYRLIDDDYRLFTRSEEDPTPDFTITFDVLGGIVNEDDLGPDQPNQLPDEIALAKLVFKEGGNNGEGNDPFDGTDRDDNDGDGIPDESDFNDNDADPDREPLSTVATVKVDFHGDAPGKLEVDVTKLPLPGALTSEGQPIVYAINPAVAGPGGHGNGIFGYVESGKHAGYQEDEDRLVFEVQVDKYTSDSEFKVTFTLHDNIDNTAPDENGDGSPDLLGADEQLLDLPIHFKITDSNNDSVDGTLPIAVEDDKPFFGEVVGVGENMEIVDGAPPDGASVTHDETKGVQSDDGADDVSLFDFTPFPPAGDTVLDLAADLYHEVVVHAGFSLPFGDSVGALLGVAQSQVKVSFGADGASQEYLKGDGRESVFGAISASGENERPFELFMIDQKSPNGTAPVEDNKSTPADEGNLTASPQKTNLTVTWNGSPLPVYLIQIDANTIVGYIETGEPSLQADGIGAGREAVLVIDINDAGVLSFVQLHQVNNPDPNDRDEPIQILAADGETPLIYVRASDYDGDHAIQPVTVEIQDDGPKFIKVYYDKSGGVVDEDQLGSFLNPGNQDVDNLFGGGNGDDGILFVGTSTGGKISFDFGADKPGHLSFGELVITDSKGLPVDIAALKTADGNGITVEETTDGFGNIILTAYEDGTHDKVFTMTLDAEGGEIGEFEFELNQALSHPYTDSNLDNDDNPDSAFEDNFNFAFNVIATDSDKDTAQGTINIQVDDDSPTALDDHDVVTEGKTGGKWNFASGNVVTGGDATLLGTDSNFTSVPFAFGDGTPDLPGADRPYTISKLAHDGHTYTLSDDGTEVLKDGVELVAPEGFDGKVLKITTDEGGTFEIVMISNNQSEVGEYRYTVPANADHANEKQGGPADLAASMSDGFNEVSEWETSFGLAGITLVPTNGDLALKVLSISGPNYRGIGVGAGDGFPDSEVEVDNVGPDQTLGLEIANPTDNIKLTIGALYSGGPDAGFQEVLLWQVFDGGTLVASGQILGSQTGLVTLDIDTDGDNFDKVVLTPLNNGAGNNANNSDFVLVNAEICCPQKEFTEEFDYTLRDSDGDEDTATLSIDVKDTEPKISHRDSTITFLVDEDGIAGGLKNGSPLDDAETGGGANVDNDGIHKGKINFTAGADPVTIELSVGDPSQPGNGDTGLDTVDGKNVLAAWDPATSTLVGYIEGTDPSEAANRVFTVKVDNHQTGEFTFTLLKPVEHPDSNPQLPNADENNPNLSFKINFQIEDSDCDVAYGEMIVKIDDDMPVISQGSGTIALAVDESLDGNSVPNNAGDHPQNPGTRIEDDEDGAGLPFVLTALGGVIGASKSGAAGLFSYSPGADGLQSAVYSLTIGGGGAGPVATNLVDTQDGTLISLFTNPDGTVRGISAGGHLVFAFSINAGTGEVSMAQYRAINHGAEEPAPGNHDEEKSLGGASASSTIPLLTNLLSVTLTVTDKDNDTVSKTVDITNKVTFDDDGPKATIETKHNNQVIHDESAGLQNDDQPNASLPAVFSNVGLIGWAHSDGAVVTTAGSAYGTDGPGTTVLSLIVSAPGVDSGLDDTATGNNILLFQNGSIVEGRVQGSNELVFAVAINQNGTVDVAQYRAIKHPNPNDNDEDVGISNSALQAVVTITDKDGDVATDSVNIGNRVRFDDDGPAALDDYDSVTEGAGNIATGNVVSGANPENPDLDTDENGTDGVADQLSQDTPHTISKLTHGVHEYTLSADGSTVLKDGAPLVAPESFVGGKLTITTAEGATFEIIMVSSDPADVGEYKYTAGPNPIHAEDVQYGAESLAESITLANEGAESFWTSFLPGVTLSAIGGELAAKTVNVNPKNPGLGAEDYGGIGVASSLDDEPEVDQLGQGEAMKLAFATPTDNAEILIGALFDGVQYDSGFQEVLKWEAFAADGVTVIASGQILGVNNGLVTLDIDTDVPFSSVVLTPLNNGAGSNDRNSDFLVLSVEVCNEEPVKEEFGYTLRDGDGDESSATLKISVEDTYPTVPHDGSGTLSLSVDEDGLPAGVGNSDSPADAPGDSASAIGNIPFTPGADPVSIELSVGNGGDTGLKTLAGQTVLAAWDSATSTLIGYIAGTDPSEASNQVFRMTVTNHQTGEVTFDLLKPIKHDNTDQAGDNTENWPDPTLTVNVEIEDSDCDVAFTEVKISIDDDMPVFKYLRADGDGVTIHDETPSLQDDDQPLANLPSYFKGIPGAGPAIGWAEDGESGVSVGVDFGADGPASSGSIQYDLSLTSALGVDSNLDTTAGLSIWLFQEGDIVVGRVGSGATGETPNSSGAVAFAIAIQDDGDLQVAQYLSLKHPNTGDHDEDIGIALEALQAKVTATDKDGDSVSQTVNIGNLVRFDDDGPDARSDSDSVQEDVALIATGNVYTGKDGGYDGTKDANATDGNADDAGQDGLKSLVWSDNGEGGKIDTNGQIAGLYGTLYVQADGDYQYKLNNDLPAVQGLSEGETLSETFQYKIVDGDDDSDTATLKITIKGKNDGVTITDLTPKAEGGDATVYEEALNAAQAGTDGSDPASTKESATGTFKITAPDGLDDVTISDGNDTITIVNNGVFVAGQKIADSDLGNTLEILSFDKTTGIVTYKYTLENDETHPDATKKDSIFDDFNVFADDVDGSSTTATLSIQVVDDLPTARADTDEVTEDTNTVTTGNVITSAGTTNNPAGKDTPGADDVAFVSKVVNFAAASITPDGDGETIAGKYGTLKMESDGDYTYTLNNSDPAVQGLGDTDSLTETFSYTLKDSDGDASTTTLTITIKGKDDPVLITDLTPSTNGGDATVYEKGLPTRGETPGSGEIADGNGNDNDDPSEVGTGSFKISAPDGVKDVTVNGTTIIDEGVLVPGPIVITTPLGNELTITGYDKTTGEITYSYLLKDNENHPAVQGPNDLYDNMIVTLNDEDLDPASATLSIKIVDDVPTARNDTDSVTEDAVPNTATGNVMTGAGTNEGLGGSGADTPGADGASVTKITGFGGSDTTFDGGVLEVAGQYGTLKIEADGDYTYTLNNANPEVDALNDGGTLVDEFTYRLTDGDTDTSDATLKITINGKSDDKFPVTYDDVALVSEPAVKHFNLVLIFDVSGSMNAASGIPGLSKLQAAKQAANNMLDTYAANAGDVRVMLVWFNEFGNRQETWLDIAAAKAAIDLIPASNDFALTNYETAILNAIAGFNDVDGRGDTANHEGVVYFLSDGAPTVGGNPDNSITDGTLTQWDNLLENAGNNIDQVYSVGLGTAIPGGASNPNLIDVADPDGNDNPANSVILVDDLADLNATLVGTVGTPVTGNILNGANESDPDAPAANTPDNPGDAPAHLSYFEYDSTTNNDLDIKLTWDGAGAVVLDGLANGKNVTIAGKEVTFDTEFGKMLIDFSDGDFKFTPVEVNADKVETFSYKITDKDGDPSNTSTLKITIDDQPSQILIEDISVKEGGTAQITVSLTDPAPAGGLKLNYTFTSGTATLGSDFAAAPGGAFITIPAGQTSATITVNASSDAFLDWGETYNVVLSGALPAGWAFTDNTGTVHIIDNTTIAVPVTSHSVPNGGWPSNASGFDFDSTDETETGGSGGEGWDGEGGDDSLSGGDGNDHLVGDDGEDTLNGGNHNDRLVGSDDNDVLNGGNGNDLLIGGDDFDKFDGGANNDWLDVDAADFAVGRQIAGGSGNDVLDMNGIGTFTLTGNTTGVSGIEIIQLEGGGQDKLSLSASDVTDITSAGNTLFIWGSDPNDDEVTLTGGGWTQIANNQAGNDGANYNVFQNGAVKVFVDTDIDTTTS